MRDRFVFSACCQESKAAMARRKKAFGYAYGEFMGLGDISFISRTCSPFKKP